MKTFPHCTAGSFKICHNILVASTDDRQVGGSQTIWIASGIIIIPNNTHVTLPVSSAQSSAFIDPWGMSTLGLILINGWTLDMWS